MRLKFFLISFILSLPFWWGINILTGKSDNFLFWQKIAEDPQIFTAQLSSKITEPVWIQNQENLDINAKSAMSVLINSNGERKILFQKNAQEKLPIASIVKLMAANVFLENFDINQPVKISEKALAQIGDIDRFRVGEVFAVRDLIYSSLIESNNGAIYALSEIAGKEGFISLMNSEAKNLGLKNTDFVNPTGLESGNLDDSLNFSTAEDLIELAIHLLDKPLILEAISRDEFNIHLYNGNFHHKAITTNKLLESPYFFENLKIIGGKTGREYRAGECLLLILKNKKNNDYLINVVLNTDDHFEEMVKLIERVKVYYKQ